jgi:hypothetical protein
MCVTTKNYPGFFFLKGDEKKMKKEKKKSNRPCHLVACPHRSSLIHTIHGQYSRFSQGYMFVHCWSPAYLSPAIKNVGLLYHHRDTTSWETW